MIEVVPRGERPDPAYTNIRLVECPACGADLRDCRVTHHIGQHDPEDFGLAPIGERSDREDCTICAACGDLCDPAEDTCPGCGQPLDFDAGPAPVATDGGHP
jgi:hypothetical protein